MSHASTEQFLSLVAAREGHFRLESGYHAGLWLELDALFVQPARLAPFVSRLAAQLEGRNLAGVCGPMVGGAFLAQMVAATLSVEFFFTERTPPTGPEGLYRATYGLPAGLRERVAGKRLAIVDDVISAGSAVGGSYTDLRTHGAHPVVVGALLLLGSSAPRFFEPEGVPVTAVANMDFELWTPDECPLCAGGAALETPGASTLSQPAGRS